MHYNDSLFNFKKCFKATVIYPKCHAHEQPSVRLKAAARSRFTYWEKQRRRTLTNRNGNEIINERNKKKREKNERKGKRKRRNERRNKKKRVLLFNKEPPWLFTTTFAAATWQKSSSRDNRDRCTPPSTNPYRHSRSPLVFFSARPAAGSWPNSR